MWRLYAFKIAGFTLAYLPTKIGYLIAYIVADTVYTLSSSLRNAIASNMQHVLGPEADDTRVKRAARAVLRNTAKNYFDLIKIPHMKPGDMARNITSHNWQNFEDALKKGNGVIIITAHLGSFDTAVQIFAFRSIKTTVMVEPLKPPSLHRHVTGLRQSNGISFLPAEIGAMGALIRCLHRGEVILLVSDRDIVKNGLKVKFFGEETTLPTAAARIAMKTGAAVIPAFNLRRADGGYDAYFEPAVDIIPTGDGALEKNVENIAQVMEKYIKSCPEQWVVLSPVWAAR